MAKQKAIISMNNGKPTVSYKEVSYKVNFSPVFSTDVPTLKPGWYIVIDPCYLFGNDDNFWQNVYHQAIFPTHNPKTWHRTITMWVDGLPVYDFGTAFGDGLYPVYRGKTLLGKAGVDSGRLCICPKEIVDKYSDDDWSLGVLILIKKQCSPLYLDGDCKLGGIKIVTSK